MRSGRTPPDGGTHMKQLLRNGMILTPQGLELKGSVLVDGNRIARVAPEIAASEADAVIDCEGLIIAPGFVNGHHHMYGVLSHGIDAAAVVTEFSSFLEAFWWPYVEDRLNHSVIEHTTRWACVESIESGVTSLADILEGPNTLPGGLEVERRVLEEAGLRAWLSFEACQRVSNENGELGLKENADFCVRHNKPGNRVQGFMSTHTLFTCDAPFIQKARQLAKDSNAFMHMHLSESVYEPEWAAKNLGKTPGQAYADMGVLDDGIVASQAVQTSPEELRLFAERGVRLVHMPLSNCEVGGGVAPFPDYLKAGIRCGLGSDGYVNNFFEVMRGAFLIHKAYRRDPGVMPSREVYRMATDLGADVMGRPDLGRVAEGATADLITIAADTPTPITRANVYDQLILFRNPENVRHVLVNGKLLKADGKLLTVDREAARLALRSATEQFWTFK